MRGSPVAPVLESSSPGLSGGVVPDPIRPDPDTQNSTQQKTRPRPGQARPRARPNTTLHQESVMQQFTASQNHRAALHAQRPQQPNNPQPRHGADVLWKADPSQPREDLNPVVILGYN